MKLMRYLKLDRLFLQSSAAGWMLAPPQPSDTGSYASDGCVDPP